MDAYTIYTGSFTYCILASGFWLLIILTRSLRPAKRRV
jgi:hypothetical protein